MSRADARRTAPKQPPRRGDAEAASPPGLRRARQAGGGAAEAGDSVLEAGWHGGSWPPPARAPHGAAPAAAGPATFERLYRLFLGARAMLGGLLVAIAATFGVVGFRSALAGLAICLVYAALAISLWLLPRFRAAKAPRSMARLRSPRWLATIGVDIVCFLALFVLSGASGLNWLPLLVMPMLMAGLLTPRPLALATAAGVTLALLGIAWLEVTAGGEATVALAQAGVAGGGFFLVVMLAGELAARLAREELAARGSLQMARQQAELNRLVIREMTDGVLVVDRDGRVRAANPAARALLVPEGRAPQAPFWLDVEAAWQPLAAAVERAFAEAAWPEAGRDVPLDFADGAARTLRVRMRFTNRPDRPSGETFCVLFLEDLRSVEARSRQERLAAMGRVSAGVAHEIRNPLAAIAQANALLAEELENPAQRRLAQMVADNVGRLKRIVDDVMAVAPGAPDAVPTVDARAEVAAACDEWCRAAGLGGDGGSCPLLHLDLPAAPVEVAFDADHLRRVLVNLLENAHRHGSGAPGAVAVRLAAGDAGGGREATLSVASDGEPIAPEVERHLFEPFYSTRSRGTGLGLYICRELCERYGATIGFTRHAEGERLRNEFHVALRRPRPGAAPSNEEAPAP